MERAMFGLALILMFIGLNALTRNAAASLVLTASIGLILATFFIFLERMSLK